MQAQGATRQQCSWEKGGLRGKALGMGSSRKDSGTKITEKKPYPKKGKGGTLPDVFQGWLGAWPVATEE